MPQLKVGITTLSDSPSNEEKQWIQVNPSCLLAYLGIRGYANTPNNGEKTIDKNALPILTYLIYSKITTQTHRKKIFT